jgi:branched-chain amino acid aminotransferase
MPRKMRSIPERRFVWLDGEVVAETEVRISPFDAGLTVGCAAFETLITYEGRPFAVSRHHRRLEHSCRGLGFEAPDERTLRAAFDAVLQANDLSEARLRVTVSGGAAPPFAIASAPGITLVIAVAKPLPAAVAGVVTVAWRRNEQGALTGLKTTSYAENSLAIAHARNLGADEALFFNCRNELCEGAGSNIFLVHDRQVMTPPLSSGCLAGVTRELTLELGADAGFSVAESALSARDLAEADEVFLTSTTREIQAVASVDTRPVPNAPGPVTTALQQAWRARLRSPTNLEF